MDNELREGLPPLPEHMRALPIDRRGYPVPYFVAWVNGEPDHRVMDGAKLAPALNNGLCWMCGQPLGVHRSSAIGPMCAITRTISEPASHLECLRFAVRACPWMTRPLAKRRDSNLPEEAQDAAGLPIKRNPGVICIWTSKQNPRAFRAGDGVLFRLGDPHAVEWWREGRRATLEEVRESVRTGLPLLVQQAVEEDIEAGVPLSGPAMLELAHRERELDLWLSGLDWGIDAGDWP